MRIVLKIANASIQTSLEKEEFISAQFAAAALNELMQLSIYLPHPFLLLLMFLLFSSLYYLDSLDFGTSLMISFQFPPPGKLFPSSDLSYKYLKSLIAKYKIDERCVLEYLT